MSTAVLSVTADNEAVIGPKWGEETMLRVAHAYEQATPWHREKPAL